MTDRKQHLQRNPYTAGIEIHNRRIAQTKRRDILDWQELQTQEYEPLSTLALEQQTKQEEELAKA